MYKYSGCHASRNDRVRTQTNSLRKIKNNLRSNSKKEGIPCVTNIVLALYDFFMSSNRMESTECLKRLKSPKC